VEIAQVAPLYESVPPKYDGGTERVVSYFTEEHVRQGHQVTLFASGDSVPKAQLVTPCRRSSRLDRHGLDQLAHHILMLELVLKDSSCFDSIHIHIGYFHLPLLHRQLTPFVTTLHRRLEIPDPTSLYQEFSELPVVSNSNAQREPLPWLNWQGTVYHGLPEDLYRFREDPGKYLIDGPEPFGLVMIEAMPCGTPVIAYRRGSVAQLIDANP
jgi:glycosyltransferase involved in cell wall biosynthesis